MPIPLKMNVTSRSHQVDLWDKSQWTDIDPSCSEHRGRSRSESKNVVRGEEPEKTKPTSAAPTVNDRNLALLIKAFLIRLQTRIPITTRSWFDSACQYQPGEQAGRGACLWPTSGQQIVIDHLQPHVAPHHKPTIPSMITPLGCVSSSLQKLVTPVTAAQTVTTPSLRSYLHKS
eukprot:829273-Rhodomonas_salina.1